MEDENAMVGAITPVPETRRSDSSNPFRISITFFSTFHMALFVVIDFLIPQI